MAIIFCKRNDFFYKMKEVLNMSTGKVKWFNNEKGYGFIQIDGSDRDIFAHYTNIAAADSVLWKKDKKSNLKSAKESAASRRKTFSYCDKA